MDNSIYLSVAHYFNTHTRTVAIVANYYTPSRVTKIVWNFPEKASTENS